MAGVGALCLIIQIAVATWIPIQWETPNFASAIARNLASGGSFVCDAGWRLHGPAGGPEAGAVRMFHLPGEVLYLAAAFRWLPSFLLHYVHVPLTVLLVLATVYVGCRLHGPRLGWFAGFFASLQPFVILHGPVWDDAFLSAATEWTVFALLFSLHGGGPGVAGPVKTPALRLLAIGLLAGYAAITRSSSQVFLAGTALLTLFTPSLRQLRSGAVAMLIGIALAVGSWGVRNQLTMGTWVVGTSHDGITLWESVYPSAREALLTRGQTERLNEQRMQDDFANTARMTELEANRYFTHRALQYMLAHPLDVARTATIKLAVGMSGWSPPESPFTPRNLVAIVSNALLLLLAAHGAMTMQFPGGWPGPRLWLVIVAMAVLSFLALTCVGPVGLRYRMSLEPVLWILAAGSLLHWFKKFGWLPTNETGAQTSMG